MMPMMIDLSFLSRSGFGRRGLPALLAAVLLAAGCSSTPERGQRGKRVDPAARDGAPAQVDAAYTDLRAWLLPHALSYGPELHR